MSIVIYEHFYCPTASAADEVVTYLYWNDALSVRKMSSEALQSPAVRRCELNVSKPNVAVGTHSRTFTHPAPVHLNQVGLQWNHDDLLSILVITEMKLRYIIGLGNFT